MNYALIIPAYNEEKRIGDVIQQSLKFVKDVFVVDDGSQDRTSFIAKEAGSYVLKHSENKGKGAALVTGFSEIIKRGYDAAITIDADGQHLPSEIPALISAFRQKKGDIIIGERIIHREDMPFHRSLANKIGEFFISKALGMNLRDTQSGFRIYSKEVIKGLKIEKSGFEMETEILLKAKDAGFRISAVPVTTLYPEDYSSHFRPIRDFYRISVLFIKHFVRKRKRMIPSDEEKIYHKACKTKTTSQN